VLDGLSVDITRGCWTSIIGPNGCGKSTLLKTLGGLIDPEQGSVTLEGRALTAWPRRERARRVAWLPQSAEPSDLTVRDCVALGRFAYTGWLGNRTPADEQAIERALCATGAVEWSQRRVSTLSGGERQRVSLARVLAVEAPILLLDEPTTHLDPPHQIDIARILRELARSFDGTIVSAIHDMAVALMADRLIVMGAHHLIGHGSVVEALEGEWLSQAFGTPVNIVQSGTSFLWQPQLPG
jgi:iron complex transport system ATP-binding protein